MVGPSKNLYKFTQLRDQYKNRFIQTSQRIADLNDQMRGINRSRTDTSPPPLTGAYASLITNNLEAHLKRKAGTRDQVCW